VSRHLTPLKQSGILRVRKQGTRVLVRAADACRVDPVLLDAAKSGAALANEDGSLARIPSVVHAREAAAKEYFATKTSANDFATLPAEHGAYVRALSFLLSHRETCIDAGTGDGGFLDLVAPAFDRVVAMDREGAQLALARERAKVRGYDHVRFVEGDVNDAKVRAAFAHSADAVFAIRLLHHASRPADLVARLCAFCKEPSRTPARARVGALVCLDYLRHEDEAMRKQGDVWLGFEPDELRGFAEAAGFDRVSVERVPAPTRGLDAHLPWVCMVAYKEAD
jgi:ArsR family transcriptional regulator